jgi:hypothetical protein
VSEPPDPLKTSDDDPAPPEIISYYSPGAHPRKRLTRSSCGEIALGFFGFWIVTVVFGTIAGQTSIEFANGFMLWISLMLVLFAGTVVLGAKRGRWGLLKGMVAAILLGASLLGLLIAICSGI